MIRLSRITDYGIVLMAHLAQRDSVRCETQNAREIAEATALPPPVVSKILKTLARGDLLESQRGSKGGFRLARPAREISVPQMIAVLEGPIALTDCTLHEGACAQESSCDVRAPWQRINQAVEAALEKVTLADLAAPSVGDVIPLASLGIDAENLNAHD